MCPFIIDKIGNGPNVSAWFDTWFTIGPLSKIVSNLVINSAGFSLYSVVGDLIENGSWKWPADWFEIYP